MSKATRRTTCKMLERRFRERQIAEQAAKERRLKGFKVATPGETLAAIGKRPR